MLGVDSSPEMARFAQERFPRERLAFPARVSATVHLRGERVLPGCAPARLRPSRPRPDDATRGRGPPAGLIPPSQARSRNRWCRLPSRSWFRGCCCAARITTAWIPAARSRCRLSTSILELIQRKSGADDIFGRRDCKTSEAAPCARRSAAGAGLRRACSTQQA